MVNQVRDTKIKVLANLKQGTEDERAEWKKLSISLKVNNKGSYTNVSISVFLWCSCLFLKIRCFYHIGFLADGIPKIHSLAGPNIGGTLIPGSGR